MSKVKTTLISGKFLSLPLDKKQPHEKSPRVVDLKSLYSVLESWTKGLGCDRECRWPWQSFSSPDLGIAS